MGEGARRPGRIDAMRALAIDMGGTQLRVALVDGEGSILARASAATDVAGGPGPVIAQMRDLIDRLGGGLGAVSAVGVCAPGPLDSDTGTIIDIPTMPGWQEFPLRETLARTLGLPVTLENDGIAAANGEWRQGAGRGLSHLVYVTVSTGVGGGVVADGRLLRGRRGMAGHVGHLLIDRDGPRCSCGATGCLEAMASGSALGAAGRKTGFADAKEIVRAARQGNAAALELLRREAEYLAYGFASLLHLYSPEILIMGGGVSQALDLMLPDIEAQLQRLAMPPFRSVKIAPALLGDNAGLIGAAALALEKLAGTGL